MKPYYEDLHTTLYNQNFLDNDLPDESVQMVVTSPPYWGLRKYSGEQELVWGDKDCKHQWKENTHMHNWERNQSPKLGISGDASASATGYQKTNICSLCGAWKGAYGLEPTPEMYVQHTIEILREVRRVLRKDGVVFLNLGDSYFSTSVGAGGYSKKQASNAGSYFDGGVRRGGRNGKRGKVLSNLKGGGSSFESPDGEYGGCVKCHNLDTDDCPYPALGILSGLSSHSHREQQPDHLDNLGLASQGVHNEGETSGLYSSPSSLDGVALGAQESTNHASFGEFPRYPSDLVCSYYQPSHYSASSTSNPLGTLYHIPKLKAKDLCLIPFRVAIAAQEDGWWVRSDIIWSKPNPMPESVTDRPTNSHEYILMLTKSAKYYYDQEAVREAYTEPLNRWGGPEFRDSSHKYIELGGHDGEQKYGATSMFRKGRPVRPIETGRNLRSVWTFPTQPYPEAHFAVFPEKLPELCIKAATPEVGCCSKCGAPYQRITEGKPNYANATFRNSKRYMEQGYAPDNSEHEGKLWRGEKGDGVTTIGWQPTCKCNADKVPSIVLEPFCGAGTTLWVAKKLNRKAVGYEISEEYCQLALERNRQQVLL